MFWRALSVRIWGFGLLLIAGLGMAFYLVLAQRARVDITQGLLKRQQALARAQASNISSFFQVFGDSMVVFAQLSSMKSRDARTFEDMRVFVEQWRDTGLVGGVVLTDKQGTVQLNANILGTSDVGVSLADRDYFAWAKNQPGERVYFVGQPVTSRLGATKGQLIVPVAVAVYDKGVFVGVLAASIKLQPLTERYLELMKVSDVTEVYVLDDGGELLYSNTASDAVGLSGFDRLDTTSEGGVRASGRLIAYAPISLDGQNWWLIMATPDEDIMDITVPIYIRQIVILVLVSLTMLLFGVVVTRDSQIQKTL